MPGKNGTGPQGRGPMTGRGLGGCGSDSDRIANTGQPVARNTGRGQGRGRRLTNGINNLKRRIRSRKFSRGRTL